MGAFDLFCNKELNFASVSPEDELVYGAEGPDFRSPDAWLDFMHEHGIRRVVCLLDRSDLGYYSYDLLETYAAEFDVVTHAPIEDFGLPGRDELDDALIALKVAESAGEKIVVHCIAGMGRTGIVLAAWLRVRSGLSVEDALDMTVDHADDCGAIRRPLDAGEEDVITLLSSLEPPEEW